jgi:hypothetical protein
MTTMKPPSSGVSPHGRFTISAQCVSFNMTVKNSRRASLAVLGCLTLGACATGLNSEMAYFPPSMPTMNARANGIKAAAAEAKLTAPLEMSDVRETYHGPGRFILCMRGLQPQFNRVVTYAVFSITTNTRDCGCRSFWTDARRRAIAPSPKMKNVVAALISRQKSDKLFTPIRYAAQGDGSVWLCRTSPRHRPSFDHQPRSVGNDTDLPRAPPTKATIGEIW